MRALGDRHPFVALTLGIDVRESVVCVCVCAWRVAPGVCVWRVRVGIYSLMCVCSNRLAWYAVSAAGQLRAGGEFLPARALYQSLSARRYVI